MNSFAERLKSERERLGLSQIELGELGGVKKLAQLNYEKGERHPDANYLSAIAKAGVDVAYLLTGVPTSIHEKIADDLYRANEAVKFLRSVAEDAGSYVINEEMELINFFRQSTKAGKEAILATAKAVEKTKEGGM